MKNQSAAPLVIGRPALTTYTSPRLRPLDVARFTNERQTAPQPERLTWKEVCALHQPHDVRPNKSGRMLGGYLCNGSRKNENVPHRSLIQLDIDTEGEKDPQTKRITKVTKAAPSIDDIRGRIADYEWIAVSSHGHELSNGVED